MTQPPGRQTLDDPDVSQALAHDGSLQHSPRVQEWYQRGMAQSHSGDYAAGLASFLQALELAPDDAAILKAAAIVAYLLQDEPLTAQLLQRSLAINPDDAKSWFVLGNIREKEDRLEDAIAAWQQCLRLDPSKQELRLRIGMAKLSLGNYREGWPEYELRLDLLDPLKPYLSKPRWQGESLDGKVLMVVAEQGLGDTLQFIRYLTVVKARWQCRIIVVVPGTLLRLVASADGIDELHSADAMPDCRDYWTPVMSLPLCCGHFRRQDFPAPMRYLQADPALVAVWRQRLASLQGLRIGLCWQGAVGNACDPRRSIALNELAPLASLPGIQLVSLQRGYGQQQLAQWQGERPIVAFADEEVTDFAESAALMQNLDLIITVDTAVCHLAGALGLPVWVLMRTTTDWRWGVAGEDSYWYPTMRLFRQQQRYQWRPVVAAMLDALRARLPAC